MKNTLFLRNQLLAAALILLSEIGYTQVVRQWVATYNGTGNGEDIAWSTAVDAYGNVYTTGQSEGSGTGLDYATVKYNAAGQQLWVATYNGPGNQEDAPRAMAIDNAGNVYITGRSIGSGTNFDFATIKYDSLGNTIWVRRFNSTFNGFDEATDIALDKFGNVYVTGFGATIKYDNNGTQKWVYTHGVLSKSVAVDSDGNVYITGYSFTTSYVYATMKLNSNGNFLWYKTYQPGLAADLVLDRNNNVYITGQSEGFGTSKDIATIKYDSNGNELWVARYNNSAVNGWDEAFAITSDDKGNVYVTGQSDGSGSAEDYITLKYDSKGALQWAARYNGPDNTFDRAQSIAVDKKENVYITGSSAATGIGHEIATVKYNKNGQEQWVERYNGTANGNDAGYSLALDTFGNVYVAGLAVNTGTGSDFVTIRYSQLPTGCNESGNKIIVCHKGQNTICIDQADVAAHLNHGDKLGACPQPSNPIAIAKIDQSRLSQNEMPASFQISIVPTPASSTTKINYQLPVEGFVSIKVFDILGKEVATLVNAVRETGKHNTEFDVSSLKEGLYYCRITVKTRNKEWVETKKIMVAR